MSTSADGLVDEADGVTYHRHVRQSSSGIQTLATVVEIVGRIPSSSRISNTPSCFISRSRPTISASARKTSALLPVTSSWLSDSYRVLEVIPNRNNAPAMLITRLRLDVLRWRRVGMSIDAIKSVCSLALGAGSCIALTTAAAASSTGTTT